MPRALATTLALGLAVALSGCPDDSRRHYGSSTSAVSSSPSGPGGGIGATWTGLRVGVAAVSITPKNFEGYHDVNRDGLWDPSEPFYDHGTDLKFDWEEPGALGADGKPGVANVDDDNNGTVDDRSEYLASGSDDVADPNGDNYDPTFNRSGTEGNGKWEKLALGGFGGLVTFGSFRYATGVHDDIWARTLVLEKNGTVFVWQSLDLVGMLHIDINPVKRRVERELGIPFDNIVVCSTHNHASPDPIGIWAGDVDEGLWRRVRDQMFQSIRDAYRGLRPARMKSVSAEPPSGYDPSTHEIKRGAAVRMGKDLDEHNAGVTAGRYDEFLYQTDLRDPMIRATEFVALQFDDPTSGSTIATLVNWHNHPEVMGDENLVITSDFPHFLRKRIEAKLGGTCVYVSGALGNQIGALRGTRVPERNERGETVWDPNVTGPNGAPFPRLVRNDGWIKIRSMGYGIADDVLTALRTAPYLVDPQVVVKTEPLYVDFENPLFMILTALLKRFRSPHTNPHPDDLPIKGIPGMRSAVGVAKVNISVVTLGDAQLVTSPGETAPEYLWGRSATSTDYGGSWGVWSFPAMPAIRAHMSGRHKMIASLANSYLGYLVPKSDYIPLIPLSNFNHPNFYEDQVSSGENFGDNIGNKIMQMLGTSARFSSYPSRP